MVQWCRLFSLAAPCSPPNRLQGSEREYIIVSFVRSTSQDEDVVTSVAKTAGDSMALQELGGSRCQVSSGMNLNEEDSDDG